LGEEIRRADRERRIVLLLNCKYCLIKKEILPSDRWLGNRFRFKVLIFQRKVLV